MAPILIPNCLPHCGHSNISDCPSLYFVSSNVINPSHFGHLTLFIILFYLVYPSIIKNSLPLRSLRALYASFLVLYFPYTTLMDLLPSIKVLASYPFVVSFVTKASAFFFVTLLANTIQKYLSCLTDFNSSGACTDLLLIFLN